ncbi:unnamed protein product, partial [Ectocarpus sp. 12 AP-2014]
MAARTPPTPPSLPGFGGSPSHSQVMVSRKSLFSVSTSPRSPQSTTRKPSRKEAEGLALATPTIASVAVAAPPAFPGSNSSPVASVVPARTPPPLPLTRLLSAEPSLLLGSSTGLSFSRCSAAVMATARLTLLPATARRDHVLTPLA